MKTYPIVPQYLPFSLFLAKESIDPKNYSIQPTVETLLDFWGVCDESGTASAVEGEAYFTGPVQLGKTKPYGPVYLAFAQDQQSGES